MLSALLSVMVCPDPAAATGFEVLHEGLKLVDTERSSSWLRVSYEYQNLADRRIGFGAVRCLLIDPEGNTISTASDRVVNADLPYGKQRGIILLALDDSRKGEASCHIEVTYWMIDGAYIEVGTTPSAPSEPGPASQKSS